MHSSVRKSEPVAAREKPGGGFISRKDWGMFLKSMTEPIDDGGKLDEAGAGTAGWS